MCPLFSVGEGGLMEPDSVSWHNSMRRRLPVFIYSCVLHHRTKNQHLPWRLICNVGTKYSKMLNRVASLFHSSEFLTDINERAPFKWQRFINLDWLTAVIKYNNSYKYSWSNLHISICTRHCWLHPRENLRATAFENKCVYETMLVLNLKPNLHFFNIITHQFQILIDIWKGKK